MSQTISPTTGRRYGLAHVTRLLGVARSSVYLGRREPDPARAVTKRGPRTPWTDAELLTQIRAVLAASPFVGEGHRKVWARLRHQGLRTSKSRVLRLMREAQLLAPSRARRVLGPRAHDGTIIPDHPDAMWGTDATTVWTLEEGLTTVFIAVAHGTAEGVGIPAARRATRFEALEPIRQGVQARFGAMAPGVATGLALRHDHGRQYMSDAFQAELRVLGIESSPAFVRAPEGNGCAERFIRTRKEPLLWARTFRTVEDLRQALHEWLRLYNAHWLIERHGHRSPSAMRRAFVEDRIAA